MTSEENKIVGSLKRFAECDHNRWQCEGCGCRTDVNNVAQFSSKVVNLRKIIDAQADKIVRLNYEGGRLCREYVNYRGRARMLEETIHCIDLVLRGEGPAEELDEPDDWIDRARSMMCNAVGHDIVPDHCLKPEHDYCDRCKKSRVSLGIPAVPRKGFGQ